MKTQGKSKRPVPVRIRIRKAWRRPAGIPSRNSDSCVSVSMHPDAVSRRERQRRGTNDK